MANVWIDSEILEAIGDALRYQHETNNKFYPREMASAIESSEGIGTIDDYFGHEIYENITSSKTGGSSVQKSCFIQLLKKIPKIIPTTATSLQSSLIYYQGELPPVIISNEVTNFSHMFYNCPKIKYLLPFDTSKGTNFDSMFSRCPSLEYIPLLDFSNATDISSVLGWGLNVLEKLGGFLNLGKSYDINQNANYNAYTLNLYNLSLLTYQSLMNVINNLYDIATKGCNTQKLILNSANLEKLNASDIAIATNKGWTVSS